MTYNFRAYNSKEIRVVNKYGVIAKLAKPKIKIEKSEDRTHAVSHSRFRSLNATP